MINIHNYRNAISKPVVFLIGLLLVCILGVTDYLTGNELSFSIFYLIPISLVVILSNLPSGIIISIISAISWLLADLMPGSHYSYYIIPYWNALMRLGYFILHAFIMSKMLSALYRAQELSFKDSLTGLPNWRYFKEFCSREIQKAVRENKPLTVAYIDLDNFKNINDTGGHDIGNDLLHVIAKTIQKEIRPSDMIARIGGDEFVILLSEMDYSNANRVLLRIMDKAQKEMKNNDWPVTISMGAITYKIILASVDTMVKQADELMYSVKNKGKNNLKHKQSPEN